VQNAGTLFRPFNRGFLIRHINQVIAAQLLAGFGKRPVRYQNRALVRLLPGEPEVRGLLALMLLHDSRRNARIDIDGNLIPLEEQDRGRWDRARITEGLRLIEEAMAQRRSGPYQLQAAIAALHAEAPTPAETDWTQIHHLYGALLARNPGAVLELNTAVALAMTGKVDAALGWLDDLEQRGALRNYHLLPAARADLLRRAGRSAEAVVAESGRAQVPATAYRSTQSGSAIESAFRSSYAKLAIHPAELSSSDPRCGGCDSRGHCGIPKAQHPLCHCG